MARATHWEAVCKRHRAPSIAWKLRHEHCRSTILENLIIAPFLTLGRADKHQKNVGKKGAQPPGIHGRNHRGSGARRRIGHVGRRALHFACFPPDKSTRSRITDGLFQVATPLISTWPLAAQWTIGECVPSRSRFCDGATHRKAFVSCNPSRDIAISGAWSLNCKALTRKRRQCNRAAGESFTPANSTLSF